MIESLPPGDVPSHTSDGEPMQWSSQVIGIDRGPTVRLTIALTTLVVAHT